MKNFQFAWRVNSQHSRISYENRNKRQGEARHKKYDEVQVSEHALAQGSIFKISITTTESSTPHFFRPPKLKVNLLGPDGHTRMFLGQFDHPGFKSEVKNFQ